AAITGTDKAANATDAGELRKIMQELDSLEKTELSSKLNYRWDDKFGILLWLALLLLGIEMILRSRIIPILPE
ncbi:MAG: aerotolerance regulator BatA, partial [Candidatus Cloacimonetes bacterium]|nr:aerotolerance regulator BatA [Candidatus Cloacimonadota bacterium]